MLRHPLFTTALIGALSFGAAGATLKVPAGYTSISDAVAAASAGDKIIVSKGVYVENVTIPNTLAGLKLIAKGNVILDGAQKDDCLQIEASDVTVTGFTFRHASGYGVYGYDSATSSDVQRLRIEDCTTLHCSSYGFYLNGDDHVVVDCASRGCDEGVEISGDRGVVKGFVSRSDDSTGVYISGDDAEVSKVKIYNCYSDGIYVSGDDAVVTKCRVDGADGDGIEVSGDDGKVTNCFVRFADGYGVYLSGDRNTASDNEVFFTLSEAIYVSGDDPKALNNEATYIDSYGVDVSGVNAVVIGNVIAFTQDEGIYVSGNGGAVTVRKNKVSRVEDGDDGIEVWNTTSGVVEKNKVKDIVYNGIYLGSSAEGLTVQDNTVTGCGAGDSGKAIDVRGSNNLVQGNTVADNVCDGIYVRGDFNTIKMNVVKDNLEDGIHVASTGDSNVIEKNVVTGNHAEGLENDGTNTSFIDNFVKKNRLDIACDVALFAFTGNVYGTGGDSTPAEID